MCIPFNIKMNDQKYVKKGSSLFLFCRKKKKKTGNKKIREVALLTKIASQTSLCTVCYSKKSTFLKQKPKSKMLKPKMYW